MTYTEFITITNWSESYMTYEDYIDYIEPWYNESNEDKHKWCKALYKAHMECVNTPIETAISAHTIAEKEAFINGDTDAFEDVSTLQATLKKNFLNALYSKVFRNRYNLN